MSRYQEIVQAVGNLATCRKVGIEMEGNRNSEYGYSWFRDRFLSGWDAHGDGSLSHYSGIEVTTPPMRDLAEVYNGWNVMRDGDFHFTEEAGTHVHVDVTDFKVIDMIKLFYFTASVETILFSLVYNYRYYRSWCTQFRDKGWQDVTGYLSSAERYLESSWYASRRDFHSARGAIRDAIRRARPDQSSYHSSLPHVSDWLRIRSMTVEWRLFNCVGYDETGDMAIAFALLAHNTVELVKNSTVEQLEFIVNEIMSASSAEEAIAVFCSALNLPTYPKQGDDAFRDLRAEIATYQACRVQAV